MPKRKTDNLALANGYWRIARNGWGPWNRKAKQAYKYYLGDQWKSEDRQSLEDQSRPALTINKIKPILRLISGMQRQNRQDLIVRARKGGSVLLGSLLTDILKMYYDISYADWQTSFQFFDGSICGKGWLAIDVDYTQDIINGDLLLTRENPLMIWEDPYSARYDLSDAKFIFRTYWNDKDELKKKFPKVKRDIESLEHLPDSDKANLLSDGDEEKEMDDYVNDQNIGEQMDISTERYLVKECWHREYQHQKFLVDLFSRDIIPAHDTPDKKLEKIVSAAPQRLRVVERIVPVLNLITTIGKEVVLQDVKDPFNGVFDWPLVRYADDWVYAEKQHCRGEVEDLIDPQNELNKRRSQALHHLNTSANSGWIIDVNALDAKMQRKLEDMGSKPGIVIIKKQNHTVQKIEPSRLSDGHLTLSDLSGKDMKEISNVNPDLLGFNPEGGQDALSGVAIARRQQQGVIGLEPVFDNFQFTQRILGNTILEHIRKTDVIDPQEILNLADPEKYGEKMAELAYEIKNRSKGRYSVSLSESNSSPTTRMANFQTMIDALKSGVPIPPDMLIQASDWPFKDALLARLAENPMVPPGGVPAGAGGGGGRGGAGAPRF